MPITKVQGDIAGRMRKWEPVRFGPEIKQVECSASSFLEHSAPKFYKGTKDVTAEVTKRLAKQIAKGKLNIKA